MRHQPYSARIEYLAIKQQVEDKLQAGYAIVHIYRQMKNSGQITISYSAFCDYVRGQGKRLHTSKGGKSDQPKKFIQPRHSQEELI